MTKRLFILALAAILISIGIGPAAASSETLRCGSKIIITGMSMDEVRKFCGSPTSQRSEEIPVRSGNRVTGTTEMHYWTYRRGSGQKPATLKFDQEKLVSITYD